MLLIALLSFGSGQAQRYEPFIWRGVFRDAILTDGTRFCGFGGGYRSFFTDSTISTGGQGWRELRGFPYVGQDP